MLPALYGNTQQRKLVSAWRLITACRVKLIFLCTVTSTSRTRAHRLRSTQLSLHAEVREHQPTFTSAEAAFKRLAGGSELHCVESNLPADRDTPNHPESANCRHNVITTEHFVAEPHLDRGRQSLLSHCCISPVSHTSNSALAFLYLPIRAYRLDLHITAP